MDGNTGGKTAILSIIVLVLVFSFTNKNTLNYKIANYLQNECEFVADSCIIDLNYFTDFEWDKMYTFAEMSPAEGISPALGFEYTGKGANALESIIVFVKDDKVVYEEIRPESGGIFNFVYDSEQRAFCNQPFLVKRYKGDKGKYGYNIYPLKEK